MPGQHARGARSYIDQPEVFAELTSALRKPDSVGRENGNLSFQLQALADRTGDPVPHLRPVALQTQQYTSLRRTRNLQAKQAVAGGIPGQRLCIDLLRAVRPH